MTGKYQRNKVVNNGLNEAFFKSTNGLYERLHETAV